MNIKLYISCVCKYINTLKNSIIIYNITNYTYIIYKFIIITQIYIFIKVNMDNSIN